MYLTLLNVLVMNQGKVNNLWTNEFNNSAHSCKIIQMSLEKESDSVKKYFDQFKEDIEFIVDFNDQKFDATTNVFVNCLDGKTICELNSCSTHACSVCLNTGECLTLKLPSQYFSEFMNHQAAFKDYYDRVTQGCSNLHFTINLTNQFLKGAAMKLAKIKSRRMNQAESKLYKEARNNLKEKFKSIGIFVDQISDQQMGNSGLVGRQIFSLENYQKVAEILDVSDHLIISVIIIHGNSIVVWFATL